MQQRLWTFLKQFAPVLIACVMLAAAARPAWAHALLVRSTPAANSTVNPGNLRGVLKFDSRVVPSGCSLGLMGPDGSSTKLHIGIQPAPEILTTTLKDLRKGSYMLHWQALSSDGHITRGAINFTVR